MNEEISQAPVSGKSFIRKALLLFINPKEFFTSLEKEGGFGSPILYALFWIYISTAIEFLLSFVIKQPIEVPMPIKVGWVFLGPLLVVALGFIGASFLFLVWHLLGSSNKYQTAFRCWASLTPLFVVSSLFGPIPFVGLIVMGYGFYLLIVCSIETHGILSKKAWIVWGAFFTFLVLVSIGGYISQKSGILQNQNIPAPFPIEEPLTSKDSSPDAPLPR